MSLKNPRPGRRMLPDTLKSSPVANESDSLQLCRRIIHEMLLGFLEALQGRLDQQQIEEYWLGNGKKSLPEALGILLELLERLREEPHQPASPDMPLSPDDLALLERFVQREKCHG